MSNSEFNPALVGVQVVTTYLPNHSRPEDDQYTFAYTITVSNAGDVPIQLLSRHWIITDANDGVQEVRGEGVVGEQPHLKPGESYRYTSGTILETPIGSMHGSYEMLADDGTRFDADIHPFSLATPTSLH